MPISVMTNNGTFVTADGYSLQDSNDTLLSAMPASTNYKIIIDNVAYRINVNLDLKDGD